jgi:hypothetical protein
MEADRLRAIGLLEVAAHRVAELIEVVLHVAAA